MDIKKHVVVLLFTLFNVSNAQQYWGALAFDNNTGIPGGAWDFGSKDAAVRAALNTCIKKHQGRKNNCKVMANFTNSCVAVYWSPVNKKGSWATNDLYIGRAERAALNACMKQGGVNCQKRMSFCTTIMVY